MSFIVSMGLKAEPLVRIFKGETLKLCEKGDKIMHLVKNFFSQLSPAQVYHILQARSDIFVMEQNCVYRDIDGLDFECIHIFFEDENSGKVLAYLRAFRKDSVQISLYSEHQPADCSTAGFRKPERHLHQRAEDRPKRPGQVPGRGKI